MGCESLSPPRPPAFDPTIIDAHLSRTTCVRRPLRPRLAANRRIANENNRNPSLEFSLAEPPQKPTVPTATTRDLLLLLLLLLYTVYTDIDDSIAQQRTTTTGLIRSIIVSNIVVSQYRVVVRKTENRRRAEKTPLLRAKSNHRFSWPSTTAMGSPLPDGSISTRYVSFVYTSYLNLTSGYRDN